MSSLRLVGLFLAALLHTLPQRAQTVPAQPLTGSFTAAWQPLGPNTISSISFGALSGRVLSLALDPSDATGNTLYLGTAGGGVWKSTNAAGPAGTMSFAPLTDTLPAFDSGYAETPSLFIGALAVQPFPNPVLLAGTGDPGNSTDSGYGTGILRSTDGGLTWTLIQRTNNLPNASTSFLGLSVAGMAWSTTSPSLVVAALTKSPLATAVQATGVTSIPGLYYSTDAGATWHTAAVYDGTSFVQGPQPLGVAGGNAATAVVWNARRKLFVAALRNHGYYASADGVTWKRLDAQPGKSLSTGNCPVGANGFGNPATCPAFSGALAVQPATGDTYAWTVDSAGRDQGVWQDLCSMNSAGVCASASLMLTNRLDHGELDATGSTVVAGGQSALSLLSAPLRDGSTTLLAGAGDVYRCALGSGSATCAFRDTTNAVNGCATPAAVAPGQHAFAAFPNSAGTPQIFFGNEGGLWRSPDGLNVSGAACDPGDASHFENLNAAVGSGGSAAQIVGFAQDPADTSVLLAGLGSNGTAATTTSPSTAPWLQLSAGEGGFPHIDAVTPVNWYAAIGSGVDLKGCAAGSACSAKDFSTPATIAAAQVSNDPSLVHAPSLLDPAHSSNVILGTCRVWRGPAASGAGWSSANAISAPFAGSAPCSASSPLVRSLGAGGPSVTSADSQHSGSTVLYAGMAGLVDGGGVLGGHLFMTMSSDTGTSSTRWIDVSGGTVTNDFVDSGVFNPAGYSISSIAVDAHDPSGATAYVTVMGFIGPRLYRTVDFGAHWVDLSSNLPSAPANSVAVDPNDANTVYIALDSGVYATTAINTCTTANCWAIFGAGLPNSPVTELRAGERLPTGDGSLGRLRASTFGRGIWQISLLAATPILTPALIASPTSLDFGSQQVGTLSTAQTITLTSSGNAAATIRSITLPKGFTETDTCVGLTLPIGGQCTIQVSFSPPAKGNIAGPLTVFGNVAGGQLTVALSGMGTAPASVVLTPNSLTFAATAVQQTSGVQNIKVFNGGDAAATLQPPVISGDFSVSASTCGGTLEAQVACAISVVFTPTDKGARSGTLTLVDSAGTQVVPLSGTGQSPATDTLSVSSLSFAQQAVGSTSAPQQVTLTNAGDVPLSLLSVTINGDFVATNNCGTSLPGHGTCAVLVSFVPGAVGTRSGALVITDLFRSQSVSLSGNAVAPAGVSLSPASLTFGSTAVGLSAPAQTITLTNNGGLPLHITRQSVSGDYTFGANTCGSSLAVNTACVMTIVFAPTAAGVRPGALTLVDDAPSGTQTVSLLGTGVDFSFAASGAPSQTVSSGATATFLLALNSVAGVSGNVSFACTGAPAHSICTVNPLTASLGASPTITATVQTGVSTAMQTPMRVPWLLPGDGALTLALIFPFCFARRRGGVRLLAVATLMTGVLLGASGCGTPRLLPGSGESIAPLVPTPSGTYVLTVTGTTAGISHSVPLTLIVQ